MASLISAQTLWDRVTKDVRRALDNFTSRKRVTGVDGAELRVVHVDRAAAAEKRIRKIRGVPVVPGDDVLTVQLGGREVAIGALLKPGQQDQAEYVEGLGGDGQSSLAARADHQHAGAGERSVAIGEQAVAGLQGGIAMGYMTNAGRLAVALGWQVGQSAQTGELSVGIGYWAEPTGTHAVAIGREAEATGANSTAIGYRARALGDRSTAIGDRAVAAGNDIAAISGNQLRVVRSDGTANVSNLALQDENGVLRNISIRSVGTINVGGVWHAPGNLLYMFPPNYKVGSSPAPLKSYPDDAAGGVTMGAGESIFVYGTQRNGYRPCVSRNFGMGYVRSDLVVAL